MIIKHYKTRSGGAENILRLTDYQKHGRDRLRTEERIAFCFTANCRSDDLDTAALEMYVTATRAARAGKTGKFAHIVISLASGETLKPEQWRELAADLAGRLGMNGHQYYLIGHKDTDFEHAHLVISRVHPAKFTVNPMRNDFYICAAAAKNYEERYHLRPVGHERRRGATERRALNAESHSGQQSFFSYVKALRPRLAAASTWEEMHAVCHANSIRLEPYGQGLVFKNVLNNKDNIKASAIGRTFGAHSLIAKLGAYREPPQTGAEPERFYRSEPTGLALPQSAISRTFKVYEEEKQAAERKRRHRLAVEDRRFRREQQGPAHRKRVNKIKRENPLKNFTQWLRDRELKNVLRSKSLPEPSANRITYRPRANPAGPEPLKRVRLTARGTEIYSAGSGQIRDNGHELTLKGQPCLANVTALLKLARHKGTALRAYGTGKFQKLCVIMADVLSVPLAATSKLVHTFQQSLKREKHVRRFNLSAGPVTGLTGFFRDLPSFWDSVRTGHRATIWDLDRNLQPHPDEADRGRERNPAAAGNGMPPLPGGSLDRERGERQSVLYPDAHHNLAERRQEQIHPDLRRTLSGGRAVPEGTAGGIEQYLAERNGKRAQGFKDIKEHRLWQGESGLFTCQGSRSPGGQTCLLLEQNNIIYLKPGDPGELKKGTLLKIDARGVITVVTAAKRAGRRK